MIASEENDFYQHRAQREAVRSLGMHHARRAKRLGERLRYWYLIILLLIIAIACAFKHHGKFFYGQTKWLEKSILLLNSKLVLSENSILILYYVSKASVIAILFTALLWALRRVTHMQALRSIHYDKEALANTLESFLLSHLVDYHSDACQAAFKHIFSSSYDLIIKKRGKNPENNEIKETVNSILAILKPDN